MGYRIIYGKKKRRVLQPQKATKLLIYAIVACVILFVFVGLGQKGILSPDESSAVALENMVQSVRDGANISDAVVAFCREIIDNANLPQ